jgi:hypothetical protein
MVNRFRTVCSKCGKDITSRTNQADCNAIHAKSCQGKKRLLAGGFRSNKDSLDIDLLLSYLDDAVRK